ncbi:hypothetical protein ACFWU5_16725 [Nocardia sp. NPDC058640]|uniref:hypothetical protein n=1 Tax=Nocardia sp. NPDC058640 TaxID=3346571 RepID=UPI00365F9097
MTDKLIRLTDEDGDHVYVRTNAITAIGPSGNSTLCTAIGVDGRTILCTEPVAAVLDALDDWVIEVDAA